MADSFTANVNLRKPEVGHADDVWGGVAGLNGDLDILDAIFLYTGASTVGPVTPHPLAGVPGVGLRIGRGMTLNIEGQAEFRDNLDNSKNGIFTMDLIAPATQVNLKFPPVGGTIATKEILMATVTASHPVGTILSGYFGAVPPAGYIFADGRTIGNVGSGATNREHADAERLFKHLWGLGFLVVVPPGRGASAQADWDNLKQITLPDHSGRVMAGRDDLSGTNRNVLAPGMVGSTTTGGAVGGNATDPAQPLSINVTGTATGNVTFGGTTSADNIAPFAAAASGTNVSVSGHAHTWSDTRSVSLPVTASQTTSTAAVTNVQPTIVVDVIIAL